jgi:hypothetical protein
MRYILKSESFDRRGKGEKLYCIIAGSAVNQATTFTKLKNRGSFFYFEAMPTVVNYALFNFLEETSDAYGGRVRHRIPPIFSLELGRSLPSFPRLIAARSAMASTPAAGRHRTLSNASDRFIVGFEAGD